VLLSTPLHASSNFTVSVQLANKRGFKKKVIGILPCSFSSLLRDLGNRCETCATVKETSHVPVRIIALRDCVLRAGLGGGP
jgi:hypothetical protein